MDAPARTGPILSAGPQRLWLGHGFMRTMGGLGLMQGLDLEPGPGQDTPADVR